MTATPKKNTALSLCISLSVIFMLVALLTYVAVYPEYSYQEEHNQYALIFSPKTTPSNIYQHIVDADGTPVRGGTFDFVMIAASNNPKFIENIQRLGAIFVFSPIIKGGCLIENHARFRKK